MKKPFNYLLLFCLLLLQTLNLSAQDSTLFKGRWYKPMPFPEQKNLLPGAENLPNHAVQHRPGVQDSLLPLPPQDLPAADQVPGLPGISDDKAHEELQLQENFTNLALVNNLTSYPFRTVVKIFMTYPSGASFVCSGALIDARHVLTAGHCVHSQDEGGWADDITVFPAYDADPDEYYGGSDMVNIISWTGWTQNESWEHDMAVVELDRPVGALTGWLGYAYNTNNTFYTNNTFHNPGYPANSPYNGEYMYYWYGDYDYVHSSNNILYHYNQAYGGQSGSNAYFKDANDNRHVHAVLSHGNSSQTGHTRITSGKFSDIQGYIQGNTPSSVDLIPLKTYASPQNIQAGNGFSEFNFWVHNYSSSNFSGSLTVEFYLSTNSTITSIDELLDTRTASSVSISAKGSLLFNITTSGPIVIPPGTTPDDYFVGVKLIINDFNTANNNTVAYDSYPVTVVCGAPPSPTIAAGGATALCPGQSVTLTASNVCSGCTVNWSNGQTGNSITVSTSGAYTARNENGCGSESSASNSVSVTSQAGPTTPTISASGSTSLCNGQSVTLNASNVCSGCTVSWSNGQTGNSITVSNTGNYTARYNNSCGQGPVSNTIAITSGVAPSAPSVSAGGNTSLCNGQSVTLTASNVCSGCTVNWSTGQTGTSITVSAAGSYTATNTNACGTSVISNAVSVTSGASPSAPMLSAGGSTSLCNGQSVTLTAGNVCSGCTVNWSTGQTGTSITVSAAGSYTATNTNACGTSVVSNTVTVSSGASPAAPMLSAGGSTNLCNGQSVTLTASNVCSDCTVNWSNGQTGTSITVSTAGSYTATNTNACGTSVVSNTVTVSSGASPAAPMLSAGGSTSLCNGQSVTLTASNVCSDCTVNWSNGQTGTSITVSAAGSYTATNTNACGVSAVSNTIAVVNGTAPAAPGISALGGTVICPGQSVALQATTGCSDCVIVWSNGQTGNSITVSAAGVYTASATNACGASLPSNTVTVIGGVAPTTPIVAAAGATTLCNNQAVTLNATNVCPGCTVNWSNGQSGASISISTPGVYSATYSNSCGAGATSNVVNITLGGTFTPSVQVNNTCFLAAPNGSGFQWYLNGAVIPNANLQFLVAQVTGYYVVSMINADGCSGVSDPVFAQACVSAVSEVSEVLSARMYPNPASEVVYLSVESAEAWRSARVEFYNTSGQLMGCLFEGDLRAGQQVLTLRLPEWPSGLYHYRVVGDLGGVSGNLVIKR